MSAIRHLPPEVQLQFVAEGAANIVYRFLIPAAVSDPDPYAPLRDTLLRLRKDVSWIPSYAQLHATQENLILPLFPSASTDLITQDLVALPPGLVTRCNDALRFAEDPSFAPDAATVAGHPPRPRKRHGLYLAEDEPHGLLVTDMTPRPSSGEVLVELKPKWLTQSPSAPGGSTRCRTCALRARRGAATGAVFCPLDLASGEPAGVRRAVELVVGALPPPPAESGMDRLALAERLTAFFLASPLLGRLREVQTALDPRGVLAMPRGQTPPDEFLVATTLRDCTLFLRMGPETGRAGAGLEARLGDLDLKAPEEEKMAYWKDTETALIEEGWYTGRSDGTCRLERA